MTLADIATVSGKGGLFKVLAPTKSGVILESLDEAKMRMVATTSHKLSLLNEISIYTTTREGTASLDTVLKKIKEEYGDDMGVDANSDPEELRAFLRSILPEFDETRVYTSDMKKLVKWYDIIRKYAPEILEEKKEEEKKEEEKKKAEKKEEAEPKKAAAKKSEEAPPEKTAKKKKDADESDKKKSTKKKK